MSKDDPIVTLATFMGTAQAHVARIALEAEEIPCTLADAHQGAYPLGAMIGVRLQVFREDAARARRILSEAGIYTFDATGDEDE